MTSLLLRSVFLGASALGLAVSLFAQTPVIPQLQFPAPSPASTIKQRVGITDVEVTYARPSAKGREVFGGLVPYGEVWRTGANNATKVTFSTDVKINGSPVPAGTYEIFTIPGKTEWTLIVHKNMSQWGSYAYDVANDVARATAAPVALAHPVESLTITFNDLRDDSATLNLAWERVGVTFHLEVDTKGMLVPQIEAAMAAEGDKKPYFQAAMFYFENDLDLNKAIAWMNTGLAAQPNAFWMHYRKGLILAKMGDKDGARAAANQSLELAEKQKGSLREEYLRLNRALLASLD
ncbi:MAG: DUF2911 domain-containing protein [Candidatus Didemnitutus sp.]|nr:DUF2911 domain-containing protein [Candidatus Didemnitutus sp.]